MRRLTVALLLLALSLPMLSFAASKDRLTYEDYLAQLQDWTQQEQGTRQELDAVNSDIERLQKELDGVNAQIAESWNAIYTALDTDRENLDKYLSDLRALDRNFSRWAQMDAAQMKQNGDAIADGLDRYQELYRDRRAAYPEAEKLLQSIAESKSAMEKVITDRPLEYLSERNYPSSYEVVRGDCLWNIAKKPQIYNNPFKWTLIYEANKNQIKDPDLIYPGQVFSIPRNQMVRKRIYPSEDIKTQYTVIPGDYLSRIAGYRQIYNNPAKWRLIYEANQDQIKDPNLIFVGQVLDIPYEK
jgi:hypothetical protein